MLQLSHVQFPIHFFAALVNPGRQWRSLFWPRQQNARSIEMTSLKQHPRNAVQKPQESVQIVDRNNNITGTASRAKMREKNLIHRCSFTMVFNKQGQLYVQRRVAFKETYPSFYDPAPGGVVGSGESYEENAAREIEEEMGIRAVQLRRHFDFYYTDAISRLWGRLFSCVWDGVIMLDPDEVESGAFMSLQDVEELLRTGPVCPDSKAALEQYLQQRAVSGAS